MRYFEAAVIFVGIVSIVSIVALRQHASVATGKSLLRLHDATFLLGPGFAIGVNSALLAYLMYQSQLIPWAGCPYDDAPDQIRSRGLPHRAARRRCRPLALPSCDGPLPIRDVRKWRNAGSPAAEVGLDSPRVDYDPQ